MLSARDVAVPVLLRPQPVFQRRLDEPADRRGSRRDMISVPKLLNSRKQLLANHEIDDDGAHSSRIVEKHTIDNNRILNYTYDVDHTYHIGDTSHTSTIARRFGAIRFTQGCFPRRSTHRVFLCKVRRFPNAAIIQASARNLVFTSVSALSRVFREREHPPFGRHTDLLMPGLPRFFGHSGGPATDPNADQLSWRSDTLRGSCLVL